MIKKYKYLQIWKLSLKFYFCNTNFDFLIPINKKKYKFNFYQNMDLIKFSSPIDNYDFSIDNLSIHAVINLKWGLWGFEFFNGIKTELNYYKNKTILNTNNFKLENLYPNSIQQFPVLEEFDCKFFINSELINNEDDFFKIIAMYEHAGKEYKENILDVPLLFTVKLNLNQYILLVSKILIPGFIYITE